MIKLLRKIGLVVMSFLCGVMILGTIIMFENAAIINSTLDIKTFEIDTSEVDPNADTQYVKSSYTKLDDMVAAGRKAAREVVEEGSVLLKNDGNALPLAKGTKVTLMGTNFVNPVWGGTGSGSINKSEVVTLTQSITDAGLNINQTMLAQYNSQAWKGFQRKTTGSYGKAIHKINEVPWTEFTPELLSTVDEYNTALVIIGRNGGEGNDLRNYPLRKKYEGDQGGNALGHDGIDNNDGLGYDYLGLNQNEIDMLKGLKAKKDKGEVKKIVVLINFAAMMEGNFIKDPQYGIDSALWIGTPGLGGAAIGKLLVGDVAPSGRLPDTMFLDNAMNPVNVNFTPSEYQGQEAVQMPAHWATGNYPELSFASYTVYQEGMYLGYRYTETRYEDLVLGTSNVGNFNYDSVVAYPFGYGLSYADFETSNVSVTKSGDKTYTVSVKVTNTSSSNVSGKYSVPIYVSKPYGDYAKRNGIQVPSVELVDFAKTKVLAKGESQTLTVDVNEKFFASYDANEAKTYVLMGGDYYVCVGGSAHEATNNLLMAKKDNGISINESKMVGTAGDKSKVVKISIAENKTKYARNEGVTNALTGVQNPRISNLFDFADINKYEGRGNNHVNYYDRSNWSGTVSLDMKNGAPKLTATEQMVADKFEQVPFMDGKYTSGQVTTPDKYYKPIPEDNRGLPKMGVDSGLQLIDLLLDEKGNKRSFFDPLWDTLLDQLTWDELKKLPGSGQRSTVVIDSIGKPGTKHNNGPNGFSQGFTSAGSMQFNIEQAAGNVTNNRVNTENSTSEAVRSNRKTTGFASNGTLAATFNKELAADVGRTIGEDGRWAGQHGIFGLGLNIHRSSYLGRVCEYYSECGTLTGIIGAIQTREIEKRGVHVFNKHCALNDMETNRHGVDDWIQEQALREIYLRAFELPVYEGGMGLMSSFSRFGTWASGACGPLMDGFFRGEVGMLGPVVTDYYGDMNGNQANDPYFEMGYGVFSGGTDLCDGNVNVNSSTIKAGWSAGVEDENGQIKPEYGEFAWKTRLAAKRILYYTLTSHAMNGLASGAKIIYLTPWWQPLAISLSIGFGVIALGLAAWAVVDEVLAKRK